MTATLRFAPSPTGKLHVGNIRIALANWLYTQKHGGKFILRMDDTDTERSTQEFAYGIVNDLKWLGLSYDEAHHQSDRNDLYNQAIEHLKSTGRLYPCYETPEELAMKRKQQLARGKPPIYDGAALKLTEEEKAHFEKSGHTPHWRLKLLPEKISWKDMIHGELEFHGDKLSDPVLIREDGRPIYTLSSVVDDIDLKITHIFRGDDHIANTAIQIQLMEALGHDASQVHFGHMPLLTDAKGKSLSKRLESLSISQLREEGIEPMAIHCLLFALGTSNDMYATLDMNELIEKFSPEHISLSSPKFSLDDLYAMNEKLLHQTPYSLAEPHLKEMGLHVDEEAWLLFRKNLKKFTDIRQLWKICNSEINPVIDEPEYIYEALQLLPSQPWTDETWQNWTNAIKEKTGRKGKSLFMPLRLALTGKHHGPEMKDLLVLIGYSRAKARLEGSYA